MTRGHVTPHTPVPPQPTATACPGCGMCVQIRRYINGAYADEPTPVSPVLGVAHTCPPHEGDRNARPID